MKTVKTLKLIISGLFLSPFGIPVPGKPGLVCSPYAKGKIIDVSRFKRGDVAFCWYTAKMFRVP
jgi:hypothetical protein